jgi:hypothetical protein
MTETAGNAGILEPYPIDLDPRSLILSPVDAEEYRIHPAREPALLDIFFEFRLTPPKKFAYPCPFCLEPIPPSDMDNSKHFYICSVCRHIILDQLVVFPRNHYGRREEMALLCLEALFIRDWHWQLLWGTNQIEEEKRDDEFKALREGVSLLVGNQALYLGKPGAIEEEVIASLETHPARFWLLALGLHNTQRFREQAGDLLKAGADLKAITSFQIEMVEATSAYAFEEGGKERTIRRLMQRL